MFARVSEHHSFPKRTLGAAKADKPFSLFEKKSLVLLAQNIYLVTHGTVKKHFFQIQKTSLHNARWLHTLHKVQTWRAQQVGMEELQLVLVLKEKMCWAQTTKCTSEPLSTVALKHQGIFKQRCLAVKMS